ncbi:U3 small nucleolar RNA-associated protein 20 [Grifola frondosa]|uniref:U3 small nucleolar RNA-associated protein 20 n=1 Tax=Grifola frondosa TaxID=5627 RepID=A0A1C7LM32_GRIFR|nr:U3 small nucleolar RNA-associated protein 20 [Grifola frondosa]
MDSHEDERPAKRFKHESYKDTLKEVHVPSALDQTKFDHEIVDSDSHFHEALDHWKELNLSPAFLKFAHDSDVLSASMPLLLHNWREIMDLWFGALDAADDEALKALLEPFSLFQKLAHDLRTTLAPKYPEILKRLLNLLPRSLSAPALTALLATSTALFKYVLIPSVDSELLQQAWSAFHDVLPKCHPEVQRATAEVWGVTFRRLKTSSREESVRMVAMSAVGSTADACAWIFVSACKSVSQTLHTATTTLIAPLVKYHLTCDAPEASYTLIRRVLTALIHHCKGAEQFSPISDLLVKETVQIVNAGDEEQLRRILEVVSVACSVRQGSRVTHKQLLTLLAQFPSLPLTDTLHNATVKFAISCLIAGDMAIWMVHGPKVLERSWQRPVLGIELTGALSDLSWGGWKLIALPHITKTTHQLLESHPKETLGLLAALHREKRLGNMDIVWKQRLQAWVDKRFSKWEHTEENLLLLNDIIALSSLLTSISTLLIQVVDTTLEAPDPREEFESSYANSAWLIGACAQCLSMRAPPEWVDKVDLIAWTTAVAEKWGWSSNALGGLIPLVRARSIALTVSLDALYPALQGSLMSHSRSLRLSVLRLLTSPLVKSSPGASEVLKRSLQGEEISVDVQGSRERILRISRLPPVVKDGDEVAADACARWLIAQLKINLRPLWSAAATALSTLSERFGDKVWRLLFEELQATAQSESSIIPDWMKDGLEGEGDDIWEDERSWRDPSAHKVRSIIARWSRADAAKRLMIQSQILDDRFDPVSYEAQLLSVLGVCALLAEKHSRDLVPYFLSFAGPEASSKLPRQKMSAWLTLFSKFANPKALRSTDVLHAMYISLLSHPDRSLQRLALSCLLTYKSPHLTPHEGMLRLLLDDTRWRDELTQLDISSMEPADRKELVDVIIRLLFGMMLEKRGRSRGADRRAAVLSSLAACADDELVLLVDLMLQPVAGPRSLRDDDPFTIRPVPDNVTEKQQIGFLNLLGDVLKHLGSRLLSCWPKLLETLLDILGNTQSRLHRQEQDLAGEEEEVEVDEEAGDTDETQGSSRRTRSIRQLGIKRFADFFRCPVSFDFSPYMKEAFRTFISPRLQSLDQENSQAPSALLELFHVWALGHEHTKYLVEYDNRTLPKIFDCLIATNVKSAVISRVFDIIDPLLSLSAIDADISNTVLKPHVSLLLANMSVLVERTKGITAVTDTLGRRQISILSEIAPYLTDSKQAATLLELFSPLLRKPSKILPEKIKVDMANILCSLFPLIPDLSDSSSTTYSRTYGLLSQLFQTLRSRQARLALVTAFRCLADVQISLRPLADLMASLNAYSSKRLEEPDFDRRLNAFTSLNETLYSTYSCQDWLPILYNMLNFIQDPDELTVRSNASFTLKRFVDVVAGSQLPEYEETFVKVLYPGLKNGLRSKSEMVRAELLGVLSHAIAKCDRVTSLQEMRILLASGDEEANFFNNIHHVQIHRRTRAIRRLADYATEGHLRSATLADVFIPLVGNYITNTASLDHHLVNEAIVATGQMARHLNWGAYHALIQRYLKLAKGKDSSERVYVRAIVAILDGFHFPMEDVIMEDEDVGEPGDAGVDDEDANIEVLATLKPVADRAKVALIQDAVNTRLLPNLLQYLEKRDETEDSLRIPISVGIVQVAKHLPPSTREAQIFKLLTVLSQVLRSKSQETRDLTRDTLCRIAIILGPSYLPTILREMRAALLRGPQLHVLAYSTHALLVHVTAGNNATLFHTLDDCVSDVAAVSAEVIFGESGKDVQSDEFKTKMREVRSSASKGLDSFAIIAKFITPPKISSLLLPIRNILQETETLKVMQQVEDILRRIAGGLNANHHLVPTELLVLCHTLISQNARFLTHVPATKHHSKKGKRPRDDAIVQTKRKVDSEVDHYANNSFRFVIFGLDLFNTAHRRSRFDFKEANTIARLEPMVTVIGNTLYSNHMQVVIPGLKAAAAIVKCPLKSIEKSLPVFIRQMIDIIKQAGSTESEAVQTAFRSLASILRDQSSAQIKEKDLAAVFAMLRAIVARKFVVPEIYDLMEKVSEIMVTSQSPQVQELCRGVLLQFLLDYPQGKGRLRNQMTFLAKNLSYVYESGRKSVMELLGAMISKFQVGLVQEYADLLFVALVMVIANDDSAKCREMAAELIKNLFTRLENNQRNVIMSHIHSWAAQHSLPQLARVSSQIYGIIVDLLQGDILPYVAAILGDLNAAIHHSAELLDSATLESQGNDITEKSLEWQIPYHALVAYSRVLRVCPDLVAQSDKVDWTATVTHLLFPHAWTRTASCRLLGVLFSATPVAAPRSELPDDSPFSTVGMEDIATKLCLQLKSPNLDAALSLQIVKNLFYVGKCFYSVDLPLDVSRSTTNEGQPNEEQPQEDESSEEEEEEEEEKKKKKKKALAMKTPKSAIPSPRRNKSIGPNNWSQQPASVLKWFAAMVSFMESSHVERFLMHILSPIYRITEDDTIRDPQMDELKTLAVELQDLVQSKVGTTKFANVYNRIRQNVLSVQRERRTSRVMLGTTNPEAAAKRKLQRNIMKKEGRKRKTQSFTDSKRRTKRMREE